jgi:outer membrane protein OmpA-like peptidoglycan-associated protein
MRRVRKSLGHIGLLVVALLGCAALPARAQAQPGNQAPAADTSEDWVKRLAGLETAPDLDVADLRKQATERVKSRADTQSIKRPLVAPQLLKLPQLVAEIKFDDDAAVVRPESYRVLGRIGDTLTHPSLLGYKFLIVGHTVSTGRRDVNLTLSQRRADVIREVLINTFKVSPKRLLSLGLGEEQLLDSARPAAPANQRVHLMTVGSTIDANAPPVAPAAIAPAKAGTHKPKR